jgi:hypothetical protein
LCVIVYIGKIFKWTGIAVYEGIKVLISMPFCFFFYLLHALIEFILFIVFDVLMTIVFWPSRWLGDILGYPLTIPTNRKKIKEIKSKLTPLKLYGYMPKVVRTCYSFKRLPPLPRWDLKIPVYGR